MNYIVIGAGGIGCRLAPELVRLVTALKPAPTGVVVVDRDVVEPKNLDRQFFLKNDLGEPKADVLGRQLGRTAKLLDLAYPISSMNEFVHADWKHPGPATYFVCVDNHAARQAVLSICDRDQSMAILGANETTFAEAYVYRPEWRDSPMDPRVKYPDLLTDKTGDPLHPPCTGAALVENPQLGIANQRAASLMTWLLWSWATLYPVCDEDARKRLPVHVTSTETRFTVDTIESRLATLEVKGS